MKNSLNRTTINAFSKALQVTTSSVWITYPYSIKTALIALSIRSDITARCRST